MRRVRTRREVLTALMEHGTKKAATVALGYVDRRPLNSRLNLEGVRMTRTPDGTPVLIVSRK
jgi:hypothetical protein